MGHTEPELLYCNSSPSQATEGFALLFAAKAIFDGTVRKRTCRNLPVSHRPSCGVTIEMQDIFSSPGTLRAA